jgi:hypothetical protein
MKGGRIKIMPQIDAYNTGARDANGSRWSPGPLVRWSSAQWCSTMQPEKSWPRCRETAASPVLGTTSKLEAPTTQQETRP